MVLQKHAQGEVWVQVSVLRRLALQHYHTTQVAQMAKWMQIQLHTQSRVCCGSTCVAGVITLWHFSIPCGMSAYPQPFRRAQWMQTDLTPAAVRQQSLEVCFYGWSMAAVIHFAAFIYTPALKMGKVDTTRVCFWNTNRPQSWLWQLQAVRCGCDPLCSIYIYKQT